MSANLGVPMRFLLPLCIIAMLLTVWFYPQKQAIGFYTGIVAVILIVTSLIITMAIEVPIVKNIEQWTVENLPADWAAIRDRWVKFHVVRTLTSLGSFGCFVFTIMYLR